MAKIKRSEAAKLAGEQPPVSSEETESLTMATQDDVAPTPTDPKDSLIRTLQVALGAVSVIAVALVVAVVLLVMRGGGTPAPTSPSATPTTTASTPTAPIFFTQYVEVSPTVKPGAIILEIHSDYQCPWCGRAEEIYGAALSQLAQSGDIDLRIHIRTLIGDQVIGNDSSERAAAAALCADKVGHFWTYHSTIFANQPTEGVGYTDDQLRMDFAQQAGITGQDYTDFQTCYDTKATTAEVTAMEQEGEQGGINATPTFLVNGVQVSFDLQPNASTVTPRTASELLTALQQVAS